MIIDDVVIHKIKVGKTELSLLITDVDSNFDNKDSTVVVIDTGKFFFSIDLENKMLIDKKILMAFPKYEISAIKKDGKWMNEKEWMNESCYDENILMGHLVRI